VEASEVLSAVRDKKEERGEKMSKISADK